MVDLPFVQECLIIIESPIINKLTENSNIKGIRKQPDGSTSAKDLSGNVPKNKGVEGVLAYLKENEACVQSLSKGMKELMEFVKKNVTISNGGKKLLGELMRKQISSVDIQILCCRLFAALATKGKFSEKSILYGEKFSIIMNNSLSYESESYKSLNFSSLFFVLLALKEDKLFRFWQEKG